MRIRKDGSVESSNTPTFENVGREEDNRLLRAMVTRVIYPDFQDNITANAENPRVLYDVVVLGGFESGQIISNCRLASHLGGNYDYYERILRAASKDNSQTRLSEADGDIVFVQFVSGHPGYPVIVALDRGIRPVETSITTSALGPREVSQYNGIEQLIDNTGNFTWIRRGGAIDESVANAFVPDSVEDVKLNVNPQKVTLTLQNGLVLEIDGNTDKVSITTQGGASVSVDGANDQVSAQSAGGALVTLDGAQDTLSAETAGGSKLFLDGQNDTALVQSNSDGQFKAVGDTIALGTPTVELLEQISDQLNEISSLLTAASAHTHISAAPATPTSPPDIAGTYTSTASALDTIKTNIDSIKGTL